MQSGEINSNPQHQILLCFVIQLYTDFTDSFFFFLLGYYVPNDDGEFYQFCYVTHKGEIRGASTPFQFRANSPSEDELLTVEDECNSDILVVTTKAGFLEVGCSSPVLLNTSEFIALVWLSHPSLLIKLQFSLSLTQYLWLIFIFLCSKRWKKLRERKRSWSKTWLFCSRRRNSWNLRRTICRRSVSSWKKPVPSWEERTK